MEQNTVEATEQMEVFRFTSIRDLVNQTLQQNFGQGAAISGLSTGFRALDVATDGLHKGHLITIAVRPGMGKTAFLLSLANNMAVRNDFTIAIFSAERSNEKMMKRILESETGMSLDRLQSGIFRPSEKDHLLSLVSNIAKANILLDDSQELTIDDLEKKSRQLKDLHHVDLVIIDYLELFSVGTTDPDGRGEVLAGIVSRLAAVARELNIPVLLFSQIPSVFPSFGQMKHPTLSEIPVYLRDLSDVVIFLHRSGIGRSNGHTIGKSTVEMVVAKHPDPARMSVVPIDYIESTAKFVDLS